MQISIIGSGLAGLTAGAALAQAGHQVTVFEQFHCAGGITAPYERADYRWDLGQLIIEGLAPDEPLGAILAGLDLSEQVKVRIEDRGYVFPGFALRKPEQYTRSLRFRWTRTPLPRKSPALRTTHVTQDQ